MRFPLPTFCNWEVCLHIAISVVKWAYVTTYVHLFPGRHFMFILFVCTLAKMLVGKLTKKNEQSEAAFVQALFTKELDFIRSYLPFF
jgi:hypothetical protein